MEDVANSGDESPKSAKPKKAAVKRVRTRTAAPAKPRKKKAADASPELPLEQAAPPASREPRESRPAPVPSEPAPPPASASAAQAKEREVFVPRQEAKPAPAPSGDEAAAPPAQKAEPERPADAGPAAGQREGRESTGNDRPAAREPGREAGEGQADTGDGRGGDEREPWWKRKKDNKKKGGKWDRHKGGGRSEGGRERHPAQPPPPVLDRGPSGDLPEAGRFADVAALDAQAAATIGSTDPVMWIDELYALTIAELGARVHQLGATVEGVPGRHALLDAIFRTASERNLPLRDRGWIDLTDRGHGFIVHRHVNYRLYPEDSYLPESLIKRYGLKRGHEVEVVVTPPHQGDRCPAVVGIQSVMDGAPEAVSGVTPFEELVPYYPLKRILLEATDIHKDISMRAIDLLTPVGFGQRGLLVAPPRTGKTVLLQNMANSVSNNFPEAKLILLLVDERPEEVTDFKRHTKGEVVSSTFDEAPESHVHAAEMVIEKARRLVELGQHVVILLDSITRLARAYNALASNSGKIMSGGVEATALQKPKRFFGSARNIEGGGSLTIIGTALIDTGSRMDEVIFEEFKGTGNMEIHLDRGLSDKRIFPAINIDRSGTRKEELIYHPEEMLRVYGLRRAMQGIPTVEAMEMFITRLKKTKSNAEFLMSLNR